MTDTFAENLAELSIALVGDDGFPSYCDAIEGDGVVGRDAVRAVLIDAARELTALEAETPGAYEEAGGDWFVTVDGIVRALLGGVLSVADRALVSAAYEASKS